MLGCRAKLLEASEILAEFGDKFLAKVDHKSLDAWSRPALRMLAIVCLLCQRLWTEPCGMWPMKGGLWQTRSVSSFGVLLGWMANQCCAEQGQLHRRVARGTVASIWLHGWRTPWDVVAAVCSLAWHLGTQVLLVGGAFWCMSCIYAYIGFLHLWT